ncbi:MAG: hypothetical protein ACSLFA_06865 [Mycobacterium sp.]
MAVGKVQIHLVADRPHDFYWHTVRFETGRGLVGVAQSRRTIERRVVNDTRCAEFMQRLGGGQCP